MSENKPAGTVSGVVRQYVLTLAAGEEVFREGDRGDEMYIIQAGEVEIVRQIHGSEHRLAVLEEGDFFGEMSILEGLPRFATARTLCQSELLRIDNSTFDHMVRDNPEIPIRMLRKMSRRLRDVLSVVLEAADAGDNPIEATRLNPVIEPTPAADGLKARFAHPESGAVMPLPDTEEAFVGRYDSSTGFQPDIELKPLDTGRTTSRRHARLRRQGDGFFIREEIGVANGTFVNGQRIATGVEVELHDGDEVRFGLVTMVFHVG